jgi:hypothetical protein
MKMIKILQAVSLFSIVILAMSCRSSRPVYEGRYPPGDYPSYPPPPPPPVVYGPNPNNLPPGQAKKIYGGRSARPYAPGQRRYDYGYRRYPLIIIRTPDIVIGRYNDGRYYYRNPEGMMYWRGYDNRYYLDETYMNGIDYDQNEYGDWKYKGRKNDNGNRNNGRQKGRRW